MTLSIKVHGDRELIERLQSMPQAVHAALLRKITYLALKLERKIKTEKLSGQVLKKRTGALMSSITHKIKDMGTRVTAVVGSSKSVPYAAIHEFGGTINHPGGTAYWINGKTGIAEFVSNRKAAMIQSGSFPRTRPHQIKMPQRSYVRSSLREMAIEIKEGMKQAVVEGMKKK